MASPLLKHHSDAGFSQGSTAKSPSNDFMDRVQLFKVYAGLWAAPYSCCSAERWGEEAAQPSSYGDPAEAKPSCSNAPAMSH